MQILIVDVSLNDINYLQFIVLQLFLSVKVAMLLYLHQGNSMDLKWMYTSVAERKTSIYVCLDGWMDGYSLARELTFIFKFKYKLKILRTKSYLIFMHLSVI